MVRHLPLILVLLFVAGCSKGPGASGIDASMMDRSVPAQRDLYRHMNGGWLAAFEIPSDRSNFGDVHEAG